MKRLVIAVSLTFGLAGGAGATDWTITDLGTLGGFSSTAAALNNYGVVVGSSYTTDGFSHAFVWSAGHMTDLGTLPNGGDNSYGFGINDHGQIVGAAQFAKDVFSYNAVTWTNGHIANLGTPYIWSRAHAINNAGQIVGEADVPAGPRHAVLWQNGTMIDLDASSARDSSQANAIDSSGRAVGLGANLGDPSHAILWQNGSAMDLGTLDNGQFSQANAINDAGQIVGQSDPGAFIWQNGVMTGLDGFTGQALSINSHGQIVGTLIPPGGFFGDAALWDNGQLIDLNTLPAVQKDGWFLSSANAINDGGQIVGDGFIDGQQHAFLLSPTLVPEPDSGALILLGLGVLVMIAARRRSRI